MDGPGPRVLLGLCPPPRTTDHYVPVQSLRSLNRGQFLLSGDKLPAAVRSTQWAVYILSVADGSEVSGKAKVGKNITLLWLLVLDGFGFKLGTMM